MDQRQNTTPSKLSTRFFSPNADQVRSSVTYAPRRGRTPIFYLFLLVIATVLLTYALMYALVKGLG